MLDQAQANHDAARKDLGYGTTRLNLAKRDLERTVLHAPFAGVVAERHADPFQEVGRGQRLFDLHTEDAMEVAISVPESEISQVYLGLPGDIRFPGPPRRRQRAGHRPLAEGTHGRRGGNRVPSCRGFVQS